MVETSSLIQDALDLAIPANLQLSPDNTHIAYSTLTKMGHKQGEHTSAPIWIANTSTAMSAQPLTDGQYDDRLPRWSPDSRSVAFLSDRGGVRGRACAIYICGLGGEGPKALTPQQHEQQIADFKFSPNGKYIAFTAVSEKSVEQKAKEDSKDDAVVWGESWEFTYLWLLDVEQATTRLLFDDAQVNEFHWSPDGDEIAILTQVSPHIESSDLHGTSLLRLRPADGNVQKVCQIPRAAWNLTWAIAGLHFLSDETPNKELSGTGVYRVQDNFVCVKVANADFHCVQAISPAGDDIILHIEEGPQDILQFLLSGKVLLRQKKHIVSFHITSNKEPVLAVAYGTINSPAEVYIANATEESLQLSNHGKAISGKHFGHCLFIECPTLDGKERVDGIYYVPSQHSGMNGKPKEPLPTFVSIHGGPYCRYNDAFDWTWDPFALIFQTLLVQGIGVLVPNYRGSSGQGGRFASYTTNGMGIYDEPDIVAMVQYTIESGLTDKTRIVGGGWSQGGHLSFLSAVRNGIHGFGWRFRGLIAGAGITDWDTMILTSDCGYAMAQSAGGSPWKLDKADVRARSGSAIWELKDALREMRVPPLLILHGERDERVPITQSWGFRRALDEAGLPFQFVTYPREGHCLTERKHILDMARRMLEFIKAHTA